MPAKSNATGAPARKPRKSLSKRIRFEVMKRDSFACQYCGAKAPDVILHIDHINPIAGGGDNEIVNLVTACADCNLGKGARGLKDGSVLEKQRAQLDELNKRREQLEMMVKWRAELAGLEDDTVDVVAAHFEELTACAVTDAGRAHIKKWLKRFSMQEVLEAIDGACATYFKGDDTSRGKAFEMVPRVANATRAAVSKPYMKDLFYIRAIARNRVGYFRDDIAIQLLERAYHAGMDMEQCKEIAKGVRNWSQFRSMLEDFLAEYEQ